MEKYDTCGTSTGIMRKQMSQNTCLELAEAPEGDGCKNNARKVSNKKNRKQYECTTDQEL